MSLQCCRFFESGCYSDLVEDSLLKMVAGVNNCTELLPYRVYNQQDIQLQSQVKDPKTGETERETCTCTHTFSAPHTFFNSILTTRKTSIKFNCDILPFQHPTPSSTGYSPPERHPSRASSKTSSLGWRTCLWWFISTRRNPNRATKITGNAIAGQTVQLLVSMYD